MTRHLYNPDLILDAPSPPAVQLAAAQPFTIWTERVGGIKVTDCTTPDGVTPYPTDVAGNFVADSSGVAQWLRGPDDDSLMVLYRDTGSDTRYPMLPVDFLHQVLLASVAWLAGGVTVDDERIQDVVGAMLIGGTYDDAAGTYTLPSGGGGGGVTDHGALSGLLDDDHPQYLTTGRGDARYYTQAQVTSNITTANTAASTADRNRVNHFGTQAASSISDLAAAVVGIVGAGLVCYQNSTDSARRTVPAGYLLFILGDADPAWMQTSDYRIGADGVTSGGGGTGGTGSSINDVTASTTTVYSSSKTDSQIAAAVLKRLRFDVAQALTAAEKTQGLANLGAAAAVHTHSAADLASGTVPLARMTPGSYVSVLWDATNNTWTYNGAALTSGSRPGGRADIFCLLSGGSVANEATFPAVAGDVHVSVS